MRTLLSFAAQKDLLSDQMDVTTAFLNGYLSEEIFMEQLLGSIEKGKEHLDRHVVLCRNDGSGSFDQKNCQSLIGSLLYAALATILLTHILQQLEGYFIISTVQRQRLVLQEWIKCTYRLYR